jgi:hypothetical protein
LSKQLLEKVREGDSKSWSSYSILEEPEDIQGVAEPGKEFLFHLALIVLSKLRLA